MRRNIKLSMPQFMSMLIITILATTITVLAATGTTDAPNAPGLTSSYTLEDIYQRLTNGTTGSQSTFTNPAVAPGTGSMHDLNDIMAAAPRMNTVMGATADQVLDRRRFWGLTNGQWGLQTGTIPVRSDVTGTDGQLSFNIPNGYYESRTATATDSDLLAINILDGVEIFGVTGNIPIGSNVTGAQGLLTFDIPNGYYSGRTATATDSDLLAVNILNGVEIFGVTGNIPTGSNVTGAQGLLTFDIPNGYYSGRTATASDSDLLAGNILAGTNIFGVEGERHGGCVCEGHMVGDTGTRWCDNEDGTITDMQNECLIWLKNASCLGQDLWGNTNEKVSSLNSGQCGLSDGSNTYNWRLPTLDEMTILTSGTDYVQRSTPQGFTGVQNDYYWTGTINASDSDYAWVFNVGTIATGSTQYTIPYYIWAVKNDY